MTLKTALAATAVAFAIFAPPAMASSGLVGQWQLNDGAGAVAADSSGYGDNGVLIGGATWVTGPLNGALSFDGATGKVRVPNGPQLEPPAAVTVSAWVEHAGSPGAYRYVLAKGGFGCTAASYGLYSGPGGGLQFYVSRQNGAVYARSAEAGQAVWDGKWHLAVGTFDGTTIRLYVDGAQVGSGTQYPGPLEYLLRDSNDLFIGNYPSCGGEAFLGDIADVQVWNRALSPAEVAGLGQPGQQLPPAGGSPPAPGQGGAAPGGVSQPSTASVIRLLSLSPITVALGSLRNGRGTGPVITYSGSKSGIVVFTVLKLQAGPAKARCTKSSKRAGATAAGRCVHYVALGTFSHRGRAGVNRVRLPSRLRLSPGKYMLNATPLLNGAAGKTVSIHFRILG
jgi:Concanavalin A-like lectin/glucanases superfamily